MQGLWKSRRVMVVMSVITVMLVALVGTAVFTQAFAAPSTPLAKVDVSYVPSGAKLLGAHSSQSKLTIEVSLAPSNGAALNALLSSVYDPNSPNFRQYLGTGEFNRRFAPSALAQLQVRAYLKSQGFTIIPTNNAFLVRAVGTTGQAQSAFHTRVNDYKNADGKTYFSNASSILVPANVKPFIQGIIGLSNTLTHNTNYTTTKAAAKANGTSTPKYGGAPLGSGLTPSQLAGLYNANAIYHVGPAGKGAGKSLAVFELSGYNSADIPVFENQFGLPHVNVTDVNVDGGPVTPICPSGDLCGPFCPTYPTCAGAPADYSGDVEVEADVETQIAIAPSIDHIYVYNAPNDAFGITSLDEYFQIASDNTADVISSSWGLCESDAGFGYAVAEYNIFAQMALQGQTVLNSTGDTGAFGCIRGSGGTGDNHVVAGDPAAQPLVTAVGGTSFGTFDPQTNANPTYPTGSETVWNPLGRCRILPSGATSHYCADFGAGGGAPSMFWGAGSYQSGPGVVGPQSIFGSHPGSNPPGCQQATSGQLCRETPDISANADEFTPYAEYCTGVINPTSQCHGNTWFGIGGTSLSTPLWSGIIAIWDSYHQLHFHPVKPARFGLAGRGLYSLLRDRNAYTLYFHDITGVNQNPSHNGFYNTTTAYDMATGIGTPNIFYFAVSNPYGNNPSGY